MKATPRSESRRRSAPATVALLITLSPQYSSSIYTEGISSRARGLQCSTKIDS